MSDLETSNIFISHYGKLVNQKINIMKTLEPSEGKELKFEGLQYNIFQLIFGLFFVSMLLFMIKEREVFFSFKNQHASDNFNFRM